MPKYITKCFQTFKFLVLYLFIFIFLVQNHRLYKTV